MRDESGCRRFPVGCLSPSASGRARSVGFVPQLSEREAEVLKLATRGYANKEIARQLDVSVKSIETVQSWWDRKARLENAAQLIRFAAAEGWLADA
jgi:DNA-binding NarL/FixJ family response regulator